MAAPRQLDPAYGTATSALILATLLSCCCVFSSGAQQGDSESIRLAAAYRALDSRLWEEAAKLAAGSAQQSAEFDLIEGLALAQLGQLDGARAAFASGRFKKPGDARFRTELAGIAYKQKRFSEAKRELHAALKLDRNDRYDHEFLGTIYFLEGNLEAALKYWNVLDKPRLSSVSVAPPPQLSDDILGKAIGFNAPQVLTTEALLNTNARLDTLVIFSRPRIELSPAANTEGYDSTLHLQEKNAFGDSWIEALVSTFSGVPYSTIYPAYFNAGDQAINFAFLARWDSQKRRFSVTGDSPLFHNPTQHLKLFLDARDENWNLAQTFSGSASSLSDVNVRTVTVGASLKFVPSGSWSWSAGIEGASRSFRGVLTQSLAPSARPFFTDSGSLAVWLSADRSLLRIPERRFSLDASTEARAGRNLANALGAFGALRASLLATWFPKATGDDYEMNAQLRSGVLAGHATLDELFELGVERDNDLWLRGHTGTSNGRKGAAPLGRRYFLANWELNKNIYNAGFLKIRLGPVLDTGAIADSSGFFGSGKWLVDVGGQCKVQVLGNVTLVLSYGHDIRGGHNVFFPTVLH